MAANLFIVIDNQQFLISVHKDQADANTEAARDEKNVAVIGTVVIPDYVAGGGWRYVDTKWTDAPPPPTSTNLIKAWRDQIGSHARIFDLGIRREWAEGQIVWGIDGAIDATETNLDRWINTMDWGRGWCGYVWRSVSLYEAIASPTETQTDNTEELIKKLAEELPSVEHVEFWYHNHTPAWLGYRHQVWTTNATAGGGARIDSGTTPNNAEWNSNYIAHYHNALRHHVGAV